MTAALLSKWGHVAAYLCITGLTHGCALGIVEWMASGLRPCLPALGHTGPN